MDRSRIKLVGAIVMALSMPSIWQTRSSSVVAQVDKEKGTEQLPAADKGSETLKVPGTGKVPGTAKVPGTTTLEAPVPDAQQGSITKTDAETPPVTPLSAIIEKQDIELKLGKPLSDSENRRKLLGEALAKHGTPGLFVAAYMNGPWTIQRALKGSSGERSGLKAGDIIISVDGRSITGMEIRNVYLTVCGYRGQYRTFLIKRGDNLKTLTVPLWGINDMTDRRSQYIEYYWYLLYHNLITLKQYERAVQPFLYFKVPTFKKLPSDRSRKNKAKSR